MSVARGALLNLAGHLAPLAAALLALPVLVARLDADRFGFLSLAWVIVGYFSLFDLGLGRALARLVAERLGTPRESELPALTRTALALTFALGALAGALLLLFAAPLCEKLIKIPLALQAESVDALRLLAVSLPFVTLAAALRGILEAGRRFGWVNAIRIPLGILTFAGPAALVLNTTSLVALAVLLMLLRVATLAAHWFACARLYPRLMASGALTAAGLAEMLRFGAWLTVSNVVGPLMVYLDRFVIGAMIAVSAVAYYAAPYEVVTRLWIVPMALSGVLFPVFVAAQAGDPGRTVRLYRVGIKAVLLMIFPLAFAAALFAPEWMELWLGADYAARGARVAQILLAGVLVNCLAQIPYTLLQAAGRADLTAKTHLAELPFYIALLAVLTSGWGIEGAAIAWSARCAVDALVLFLLAARVLPAAPTVLAPGQRAAIALLFAFMLGALVPAGAQVKLVYLLVAGAVFCALGWRVLLDPEERRLAKHPLALLAGGEALR